MREAMSGDSTATDPALKGWLRDPTAVLEGLLAISPSSSSRTEQLDSFALGEAPRVAFRPRTGSPQTWALWPALGFSALAPHAQAMQSSTAYSDSESDDEAPEEVALTSAKRSTKEAAKKTKDLEAKYAPLYRPVLKQQLTSLAVRRAAAARKAKNKAADTKHKAGKAKKAKVVEEEEVAFEDEELDLFSGSEEEEEDELDSEEEEAPAASSSTYLDPALFASAAKHFEPEQQPKAGKGKHAMKRMVRAEKKARAIAARERAEEIGVGGERRVG